MPPALPSPPHALELARRLGAQAAPPDHEARPAELRPVVAALARLVMHPGRGWAAELTRARGAVWHALRVLAVAKRHAVQLHHAAPMGPAEALMVAERVAIVELEALVGASRVGEPCGSWARGGGRPRRATRAHVARCARVERNGCHGMPLTAGPTSPSSKPPTSGVVDASPGVSLAKVRRSAIKSARCTGSACAPSLASPSHRGLGSV